MSVLNSFPKSLDFHGSAYNAGYFLGYLCNINHYINSRILETTSYSDDMIFITADTSKAPAHIRFTDGVIENITDIIDLHTRTLWRGNAKLHIPIYSALRNFINTNNIYINKRSTPYPPKYIIINCTELIEALITDWGFVVHKKADKNKAFVFPPVVDTFNIHGDESALRKFCDTEKKALAENDFQSEIEFNDNEFIRGLIEGFSD